MILGMSDHYLWKYSTVLFNVLQYVQEYSPQQVRSYVLVQASSAGDDNTITYNRTSSSDQIDMNQAIGDTVMMMMMMNADNDEC